MEVSADIALAGLALVASSALALYVALRTLLVWRSTRGVPELAIGTNVLSISIGGVLLGLFIADPGLRETPNGALLYALMIVTLVAHPMAMAIGTWRIFRAADRWPLAIVGGVAVGMAAYAVIAFMPDADPVSRNYIYESIRFGLFGWTAFECFRYRGLLRKRVSLGLAEPMMAHRIGLWGIAGASQMVTSAMPFMQLLIRQDGSVLTSVTLLYVASGLGLLAAVCIALAFFPPSFYVGWVDARHDRVAG